MRYVVLLLLALNALVAMGQSESEDDLFMALDEQLFMGATSLMNDPYSEATKYYTTPVNQRRRGLDWWVLRDLNSRFLPEVKGLELSQNRGRVRLSGATRIYQIGLLAEYGCTLRSGLSVAAELDFRTGRDMSIEGLFSRDLRPKLTMAKGFAQGDYLSVDIEVPWLMRGLQSTTTEEAMALTGDNLYNPSWGLYDGEVRNARVSQRSVAELDAIYHRDVWRETTLDLTLGSEYGRSSVSRLSWYDAYNPTPDYYRKLPSYLQEGEVKEAVESVWRGEEEEYTQIAWDKLVLMNQRSAEGQAHYIVEDQVTRVAHVDLTALFSQQISSHFLLRYGGAMSVVSDRQFKELDDLLGADYHLDNDQYIGDYANLATDMSNDLRNPNRKVVEGERFGYDYTRHRRRFGAILGLDYSQNGLSLQLNGRFADDKSWREGHYEKERFEGEGAEGSYGNSSVVKSAASSFDMLCSQAIGGRSVVSLRGSMSRLPQDHRDLFIDEQSANRFVDNTSPRKFSYISLGYSFRSRDFTLSAEGYYQQLSNQCDVWSGYDDLSYTYTDIVVSGISTRSIGLEGVCNYQVNNRLSLDLALAIGDYTYNSAPVVQLYDNVDMQLISTSNSVATEGCKVGNAPQIVVSGGVDIFITYGFSMGLDYSYAAQRYIAPSLVRRSERVIRGAGSDALRAEIIEQRELGSVFDLGLNAMRSFDLGATRRMTIYLRVENLMGDSGRVDYGRESSRLLRGAEYSTTGSYYLEADEFSCGIARSYYLSCSYTW